MALNENDYRALTRAAVAKYEIPAEIAMQMQEAGDGLRLCEQRLVARHFAGCRTILVIGSGAGREAFALARLGFQVTAGDLNETLLKASCRVEGAPEVRRICFNATALPVKTGAYDGATMLAQMISMIPGRENRLQAIREAYRILKPGGMLLISTHNRRYRLAYSIYFGVMNPLRRLGRALGLNTLDSYDYIGAGASEARTSQKYYRHIYGMHEMLDELRQAGFRVVECKSRQELNEDSDRADIRESDYYIYYAAQK